MSDEAPVVVARIARAHGIHGGLLLEAETDHAEALFQPGRRLLIVEGTRPLENVSELDHLTIGTAQLHGRRWLVTTEQLPDRTAAEKFRGAKLGVSREELPDLGEDGYLLHDLIGMTVVDGGVPVGVIREVYDQPGAPLLEIEVEGRQRLVPFQEGVVEEVHVDSREVHVTLPAGLLDI